MEITVDTREDVDDELIESIAKALSDDAEIVIRPVSSDDRPGVIKIFEGTVHTHRLPFDVVGTTVTSSGYMRVHLKDE